MSQNQPKAFALWFQYRDLVLYIGRCVLERNEPRQPYQELKKLQEMKAQLSPFNSHFPLALISDEKSEGVDRSDTQKGMLSGISQERNLRSKI